jgi:hypothetical protein
MKRNQQAICVLGMHRSGTSSVTKGVHEMGAYIGAHAALVPPDVDNPRGFWEHKRIVELQDAALQVMRLQWDTATPIPRSWFRDNQLDAIRDEMRELIVKEFGNQDLWVWKDPRTSILLPLWEDIFADLNIDVKYLIVIRNPIDVANSLLKRNGFSRDKSMALWLNYTLSALRDTNGSPRVMIDYDDYLRNWKRCLKHVSEVLSLSWPTNDASLDSRMNSFLSLDLQHSRSELDEVMKSIDSSLVKDVYAACWTGIQNSEWLKSDECTSNVERMSREYAATFYMFASNRSEFVVQCQYRSGVHGGRVTEVETHGSIDDEVHEYIFDIPDAVGDELAIGISQFSGIFDVTKIELQYRKHATEPFQTVRRIEASNLQGIKHTALSMTFPSGGLKFLNIKGASHFHVPYSFESDGEYALRFVMRAYRENHPIYTNVMREIGSLMTVG